MKCGSIDELKMPYRKLFYETLSFLHHCLKYDYYFIVFLYLYQLKVSNYLNKVPATSALSN